MLSTDAPVTCDDLSGQAPARPAERVKCDDLSAPAPASPAEESQLQGANRCTVHDFNISLRVMAYATDTPWCLSLNSLLGIRIVIEWVDSTATDMGLCSVTCSY